MKKQEMIDIIAERTGESKAMSEKYVNAMLDLINETLQMKKDVILYGIGTLKVTDRKERKMINPHTKKEMYLPKRKGITFRASQNLKDSINEK